MEESKQNKIALLRQMVENAERNIAAAKLILSQIDKVSKKSNNGSDAAQVIEGTFDGEKMAGLDGKKYPVPPNYASKSKLVEGDLLKLSITEDGSFLYKQISPMERRKSIGTVMVDDKGKFYVASEGRRYKVLLASLTYFKANEGDEVTIVVPKEKISKWASIEAVLEKSKPAKIYGQDKSVPNNKKKMLEEDKKEGVEKKRKIDGKNRKEEIIEDEWTPNIEDIKKEAGIINLNIAKADEISNELSE